MAPVSYLSILDCFFGNDSCVHVQTWPLHWGWLQPVASLVKAPPLPQPEISIEVRPYLSEIGSYLSEIGAYLSEIGSYLSEISWVSFWRRGVTKMYLSEIRSYLWEIRSYLSEIRVLPLRDKVLPLRDSPHPLQRFRFEFSDGVLTVSVHFNTVTYITGWALGPQSLPPLP